MAIRLKAFRENDITVGDAFLHIEHRLFRSSCRIEASEERRCRKGGYQEVGAKYFHDLKIEGPGEAELGF